MEQYPKPAKTEPDTDDDGRIRAELSKEFFKSMLKKWKKDLKPYKIAGFEKSRSQKWSNKIVLPQSSMKRSVRTNGGIYFICCQDIYPVYVGMTSQTFEKRWHQHESGKTGVINNIRAENWEPDFCADGFTLYMKAADIATAKFLESIFLAAFDFARNKEENSKNQARALVESGDEVDGKEHFLAILVDNFKNLENAINEFKSPL